MEELENKIEALLEEVNSRGIEFTGGQHAIVCNDGVVILNVEDDGVGIIAGAKERIWKVK